ncbi:MAG: histidine phosphatase family protein [Bacillus sp. (in: firmicutes)]
MGDLTTIGFIRHGVTDWNKEKRAQGASNIPLNEEGRGQIEGTIEAERVEKWGEQWRGMDLGMETAEEVLLRSKAFMMEAVEQHPDKRVLVVSHGALIGITLKSLFPGRWEKQNIGNTSLSILSLAEETWECTLFNCTKHLALEEPGL